VLEHIVVCRVWTYPHCCACCRVAHGYSCGSRIRHANSHFYADVDRHPYAETDFDADADSHSNSNSNSHINSVTYTYPNANSYAHAEPHIGRRARYRLLAC